MFTDDVVLCCEKTELDKDLERWRNGLEKRRLKVSRAKTEYMFLNGVSRGSVRMQDHQLPDVREFKYFGSMLQTDGGVEAEISQRIQSGWNNWKMAGMMFDKRILTRMKGKIHRTLIHLAMLYGLKTVPQTKKTTRRLEVAEMKMCR